MKKRLLLLAMAVVIALFSTGCLLKNRLTRTNSPKTEIVENTDEIPTDSQATETDQIEQNETEPIVTEPAVTEPEITKSDIVGNWMSVRRENNCLYTHAITLNEDGTAQSDGRTFYNSYYMPMQGEEGWYTAPMGFPSDYGTYTLNGSTLEITYTRADYGEYEPYTDTIVISSITDGKMTVDTPFGIYLRADTPMTVLSLCESLGVDYSAG